MTLEEILHNWDQDSSIKREDIAGESLKIPQLHSKYLKLFVFESSTLKKLKMEQKKLYKVKWEYYLGQLDTQELRARGWQQFQLRVLKQDIDVYLDSDDDLSNIQIKIDIQQEKVSALDQIIKTIGTRNFVIKNHIDMLKFENGIV